MTLCAFGVRCAGYDPAARMAGVPVRPPLLRLCRPCLDAAARDIAALALDYRDLAQRLPGGGGAALSGRVSGTAEPGTPLALDIEALMREIHWTLTVWEPPVREIARLPPERTRGVRPGWAVRAAVGVIAPRVDVLAALPPVAGYGKGLDAGPVVQDGLDAVWTLRELHRRARAALGLTRLVHRLPGDCSDCGAAALRRDDGSDTVRCAQCDCRWTYDDYRRYVCMILEVAP